MPHSNSSTISKSQKAGTVQKRIPIPAGTRVELISRGRMPHLILQPPGAKTQYFAAEDQDQLTGWALALRTAATASEWYSMASFNIIDVIGRGLQDKIMLVQSKATGELFAIKSMRKLPLVRLQSLGLVLRERDILVQSNNPFIVHLKSAFQTPAGFYPGLEYVPWGDLFRRIDTAGALPLDDVRLYMAELAVTLE